MKKLISVLLVSFLALAATMAQATVTETQIDTTMGVFLDEINKDLPDNAVSGTAWSDAYIGSLIGPPPHFGIGFTATMTNLDSSKLQPVLDLFSVTTQVPTLFLPSYAAEARIGGFILPFDLGVRYGIVPSVTINGITFDYMTFGADIRFALMEEDLIKPDISIGAGFYYAKLGLSYTFNPLQNTSYSAYGTDETISLGANTTVFDFKAQISKNLLLFTPYLGVAESISNSSANYDFAGFFSHTKESGVVYGTRVYGGLSLNIFLLRVNLSGSYNLINKNWGVNAGLRVQL